MPGFNREEIKMLAEAERMMDSGEAFYVVLNGQRVMVQDLVAEELGLERGQTINGAQFPAILEAQIAAIQAEMATIERTIALLMPGGNGIFGFARRLLVHDHEAKFEKEGRDPEAFGCDQCLCDPCECHLWEIEANARQVQIFGWIVLVFWLLVVAALCLVGWFLMKDAAVMAMVVDMQLEGAWE